MDKIVMVYVPVSGNDNAEKIGTEMVSLRLAACANIFDGVRSVYRWEGIIQSDSEAVLIMKTKESLFPELEKRVKELHSYDCPCIVAIPITNANKEYVNWVIEETK